MVGIVILNYNNAGETIACIESIIRYNTYPAKIIIVDNGSKETDVESMDNYMKTLHNYKKYNEKDKIPESLSHYVFFVSSTNDGYAKGNNKGIKLAIQDKDIDNILILNNDILFYEDIIGRLVEFQNKNLDIGVVCPLLYTKDKNEIDYTCARSQISIFDLGLYYILMCENILGFCSYLNRKQRILITHKELLACKKIPIEMPSGSCFLIRKSLFKEIGLFDEGTFLYYEENILQKKLEKIHKRNFLLPDIGCIHLGAATTLKTKSNTFLISCEIQSAKRYVMKYCNASLLAKMWFMIGYFMMLLKIKILEYRKKYEFTI